MDKLQYDSLYKFLVSLGIILITLPIAALAYLLSSDPVLISQMDFSELSEYSQQGIEYRNLLTSYFVTIFPWFGVFFICLGIFLLIYGICKWNTVQKNLDKKLDAEATMQALSLMEMSSKEVEDKVEAEVNEDASAEVTEKTPSSAEDAHVSRITKYKEIEDRCYDYYNTKYATKYSFKRNIRMGRFHYDFIGVSKTNNTDLIAEVKNWRSSAEIPERLCDFFYRIYDAGINYETIAHRNFRIILIVVASKEQLPQMEHFVESSLQGMGMKYTGKIEIAFMAEETL